MGKRVTDLYTILGVKRTAARKDIHKAYRKKAKTAHPDAGGSGEHYRRIAEARDVLLKQFGVRRSLVG